MEILFYAISTIIPSAIYDKHFKSFLVLLKRLETSSRLFYDFDNMAIQYDLLIFSI